MVSVVQHKWFKHLNLGKLAKSTKKNSGKPKLSKQTAVAWKKLNLAAMKKTRESELPFLGRRGRNLSKFMTLSKKPNPAKCVQIQ